VVQKTFCKIADMYTMLSPWKTVGFIIYIIIYFTALDVYHQWPAPTVSSAFFKILPILHLVFVVVSSSVDGDHGNTGRSDYSKWISIGLLLSSAGDAFLVWPDSCFLAGTIMFGIAQVCYIRAFGLKPIGSGALAATFGVLTIALYFFVVHDLPDVFHMKIAVMCYLSLISTMTWRATSLFNSNQNIQNLSRCIGAIIFVISDYMVAFDKFRGSFYYAPFWIMITYYSAQFFIAVSAIV